MTQTKDAKIIFTSELKPAYSTNKIMCDMIIRSRLTQKHTAKVDPWRGGPSANTRLKKPHKNYLLYYNKYIKAIYVNRKKNAVEFGLGCRVLLNFMNEFGCLMSFFSDVTISVQSPFY